MSRCKSLLKLLAFVRSCFTLNALSTTVFPPLLRRVLLILAAAFADRRCCGGLGLGLARLLGRVIGLGLGLATRWGCIKDGVPVLV